MKGVKCFIKYQKLFIILALLFVPCFFLLKNTNSASALSLNTDFLQGYISTNSSPNTFTWSSYKYLWNSHDPNASPCDSSTCYIPNVYYMRGYQINYVDQQTEGNHASLHFELNIVFQSTGALNPGPASFNDLDQLYFGTTFIRYSNGSGTALTTESSSINTSVTRWVTNSGFDAQTLTIYGDITVSGVPANTLGHFQVTMYAPDVFAQIPVPNQAITYFEQNPTSVIYANNLNDALLSQQIAQQEVANQLALQQQQQDQQDRDDLQNTSNDASGEASDASADVLSASSSLLTIMGNYINIILHPPSSDCTVNMGTLFNAYKAGSYDTADLCHLSPPPAVSTIATVLLLGLLIPFIISIINTFLSLMKGATQ